MSKNAESESAHSLPIIDWQTIDDLLAVGQNSQLLVRVIKLFQQHVPERMASLAILVTELDFAEIATIAHALKSTLSSLGAKSAYAPCHRLEKAARIQDESAVKTNWHVLQIEVKRTLLEVAALLQSYKFT